jgi:hypothetical protein
VTTEKVYTMTAEQRLPCDLHDSGDLGRFTHVTPSTLADSDNEVLVEADSDSDMPTLKTRTDRNFSNIPAPNRNKGTDGRKKATTTGPLADPVLSEDLLHHLVVQNKILTDQNKALTKRVNLFDPFSVALPSPEVPSEYVPCPMPDIPPLPSVQPCPPEPFPPELTNPSKRRTKESKNDNVYTREKELWDVLERLLRVIEATAAPSSPGPSTVKAKAWDPNDDDDTFTPFQDHPAWELTASTEEIMLSISKGAFMIQLADIERKFGIGHKSKKYGKKKKSKLDTNRFEILERLDLPPWAWKALGFVQTFLLVFILIQLSFVGGDVFSLFKKSPKDSLWLRF